MLQLEVFVGELVAVDGLAAGTVALGKVTTLDHEVLDDTVEGGALVAKALLASGKSSEVLGRLMPRKHELCGWCSKVEVYLGDSLAVETENNTAKLLVTVGHIEVDLAGCKQLEGIAGQCHGSTLWVILGPFAASEDWAKKTKVKVRITKAEMMSLWMLAMVG